MLETLKEALNQFTILGPKELIHIASIVKVRTIKKDEYLLKEGDLNYDSVIVLKGLFRHFFVDKYGVDKTLLFVPEKEITGNADTILNNRPSVENIVALENSIVIIFDTRKADKLIAGNSKLLKLQNQVFKKIIARDIEYIRSLNVMTPEERYEYFSITHPKLEQRVKQKHLASYLGITPTSLSRIRARLHKNSAS